MKIYIFISTYLILAAVLPSAYFVVWKKLAPLVIPNSGESIDIRDEIMSSMNLGETRPTRATEALEHGKIFEEMNLPNKAMKLYNDALDMWQRSDNERRQFIGDFSLNEIKTFSIRDCELMVKLLLAKAHVAEQSGVQKAAEFYLKAIEIFEFARSMESVKDRSTVYPCFHSLFRLLREGKLEREILFEKALAARFVQESKGTNCHHHACALAMSAETKAWSGLFEEALTDVEAMSQIYCINADSRAIKEVSGVDVCLIAHSRAALWYMELGNESAALERCESVINKLQYQRCTTDVDANAVEVAAVLLPLMNILRARGHVERVKTLLETKILLHVEDPAMPLFVRNMLLVLTSSSNDDNVEFKRIDTAISITIEQTQISSESDHFWISLGQSSNTLGAEACLCLAKRKDNMSSSLIDKGLALATFARNIIEQNPHNIGTVAHKKNRSIILDLKSLADEIGIDADGREEVARTSSEHIYIRLKRLKKKTLMLRAKKVLPHELLLQHSTVAFVGLTHDSLAKVFGKALSEEPGKSWRKVYICYAADSMLGAFISPSLEGAEAEAEMDDLRLKISASRKSLSALLHDKVDELRFYEVKHHCFFGSWFGWQEEGGYIHVSPTVWGVDVKLCPYQGYTWELDHAASSDYNAYRQGIENILERASAYSTELDYIM